MNKRKTNESIKQELADYYDQFAIEYRDAHSPFIEEACESAARFPDCSFGAHLNLTQFALLTSPGKLERLLDSEGAFIEDRIREISVDSSLADEIFDEFCAQVEKLRSLGIAIGHFDSHHHVHTLPRLFSVLNRVQRKYQIKKVRISRNIYAAHEKVSKSLLVKKSAFNFALKHYYRTKTTQGFTDFKVSIEQGARRQIKHRTVEVIVHPGSDVYGDESDQLAAPWSEGLKFPVRLINYRDIG